MFSKLEESETITNTHQPYLYLITNVVKIFNNFDEALYLSRKLVFPTSDTLN